MDMPGADDRVVSLPTSELAALRAATLEHWLTVAAGGDAAADSSYLDLQAQLEEMRTSTSWRVTAPLRSARKWIR